MQRKIIHIDMDAFYAAIEQRDDPSLRGKPVIVGGKPGSRGVVATASYEARKYGIRSAMSASKAYELCPHAVFVKPRFDAYKVASTCINRIFSRYTEHIETLSLDEAYLDVTEVASMGVSATEIAKNILKEISEETYLSASAGVSVNKLVAKIASDFRKPGGLTVVPPEKVLEFISELPVRKIPGVGPVMEEKLLQLKIIKIKHVRDHTQEELRSYFGKFAEYLYDASFGIDNRTVSPSRERKSLGAEDTFQYDLTDIEEIKQELEKIAEKVSTRLLDKTLAGRTITLKITYGDFRKITRARTLEERTNSKETLYHTALSLLHEHQLFLQPIRLLGISCSNFHEEKPQNTNTVTTWKQLPLPLLKNPHA
jgi:DNA polymerase IV